MAIKNVATSALTRLKNQSKGEGIPFQMVLQLFAQEEFLRKLSLSKYADNLILKGGMFIYTLTEFDSRPTRDIDFFKVMGLMFRLSWGIGKVIFAIVFFPVVLLVLFLGLAWLALPILLIIGLIVLLVRKSVI